MTPMLDRRMKIAQVTAIFGLLSIVAMPVWAEEKQGVMNEQERTARIQTLQRERANVEGELRRLQSQPEGTARRLFHGLNSRTNRQEA